MATKYERAGKDGQRVRAKEQGSYAGQRIRKGKTFTVKAGDAIGSWMVKVSADAVDEVAGQFAPRKKRPGEQPAGEEFGAQTPKTLTEATANAADAGSGTGGTESL
jgi:hypothetical protein